MPGAAVAVAVPVAALRAVGEAAGLIAVGVTGVEPFTEARRALDERKAAGLDAGMSFTYKNPARSTEPTRLLRDARSLVVGAFPYAGGELADPSPGRPHGQVARYATDDHYAALRAALGAIADVLREAGPPGRRRSPTTTPSSTGPPPSGPASGGRGRTPTCWCRATAAGSCWGPWSPTPSSRSTPRSTTAAAAAGAASTAARPGAIVAPGVVDARRCLAWMVQAEGPFPVEHRVALGGRIYGCDDCQEVCPPSRRGPEGAEAVPATAAWVDLLDLLDASDDELMARHGRWYVPKRDPRYLRRNALVALGNVAEPGDPEVVRRLTDLAAGDDDLLAEHARWALDRLAARGPGRMKHLLVTNDFPPKVGGIQSYLWELWRRLDPERTTVLTTPHKGDRAFDAAQPMRVERDRARWLLPTAALGRRIDRLAAEVDADVVLLDPALPVGLLGPRLERPYGVVLHGAEVTVPGRVPGTRRMLARVLRDARLVVAAGGYPAAEARRAAGRDLPTVVVPPGVDPERFHPLDRRRAPGRARGASASTPTPRVVLGLSRLVPRKGFDVLIEAGAALAVRHPDLQIAIAGAGRDRKRLERVAAHHGSPVRFLGRLPEADLPVAHARGRLLRHALPRPVGRARAGGLRHRVPRGGGVRRAGRRRAVRGLGRGRPRRGHRHRRRRLQGRRGGGRRHRPHPLRPASSGPASGRPPGAGRSRSSTTTCWPDGCRTPSTG